MPLLISATLLREITALVAISPTCAITLYQHEHHITSADVLTKLRPPVAEGYVELHASLLMVVTTIPTPP